MSAAETGPLSGLRVLDCGTAVVGPWAATLLSFLGADAIKIERPSGEITRLARPRQNGWSTAYTVANLCKRSMELDFKDPVNKDLIDRLLTQADVVIENYRPGVADRIGIGYAHANAMNPGVVYGSSSGWGDVGPMRSMSAVDSHLQAFSGFAALNGTPGGAPEMLRYTHIDPSGGTFLAAGILLGLIGRQRFGAGAHIVTSHLAMTLAMQASRLAETLHSNKAVPRVGSASTASAPNQCFLTQDHAYIALCAQTEDQWRALCEVIGDEDLKSDSKFKTNQLRVDNREVLADIIATKIVEQPLRWWVVQLRNAKVPVSPILNGNAVLNHTHMHQNDYLVELEPVHTGPLTVGGLPWSFSKTPASMAKPTPIPGSDTESVRKHGFSENAHVASRDSQHEESSLPLDGIQVVEFCQGYAGPNIGLLLAEAGAEVTKVESKSGDWARSLAPATSDHSSAVFDALNRNKTLHRFDPDDSNDQSQVSEFLAEADIILMDWPGVSTNNWKSLIETADDGKKIVLSLSCFGEQGPMAGQAGSELIIQAMTGYLHILGKAGDEPVRAGADIAESAAAAMGMVGVLAALYHRERTGEGQTVSVSRLGALMSLRSLQWAAISNPDEWLGPSYCLAETDAPRHGYRTQDNNVFVSMMNLRDSDQFKAMLSELGMLEAEKDNASFLDDGKTTIGMGFRSGEFHDLWESYLTRLPSDKVLDIFNRNGATAVEFPELDELVLHPQVQALNIINEVNGERYLRAPWRGPWTYPQVALTD